MSIDTANTEHRYRSHEPVPSDDIVEVAAERMALARKALCQGSPVASAIDDILVQIPTSAIDTLAVTILQDGFAAQLFNPDFVMSCQDTKDLVFIRTHEMYHLFLGHLWGRDASTVDEIRILAEETVINDRVSSMFSSFMKPKDWKMPMVVGENGKVSETGVHPYKTYDKYRKDLKEAGLTPVDYKEFISTDLRCEAELRRMNNPPRMGQRNNKCPSGVLQNGSGGQSQSGDDGHGGHNHPTQDKGTTGTVVEESLNKVMNRAKSAQQGTSNASRDELLNLMDTTEGSETASEIFGDMGVGALRGETSPTRKVEFWKQYLQNSLHERLQDGETYMFNEALIAFPGPPRISPVGEEAYKQVLIAVDASGSMHPNTLEYISNLLGDEDNLKFDFVSFDAEVWPFELGGEFRGGGGTRFDIIDEYINRELSSYPDAVIVVTDGYAPHFTPTDPDRWVWLITEGGDPWPQLHDVPMETFVIDNADLQAGA